MYSIREATKNDSIAIAAIDAMERDMLFDSNDFENTAVKYVHKIPDTAKEIRDGLRGTGIYTAVNENEALIGYCSIGKSKIAGFKSCAQIRSICVLNNYRRQGIGTALFKKAGEEIAKMGYDRFIIGICSDKNNSTFLVNAGGKLCARTDSSINGASVGYEIYLFDNLLSFLN